MTTTLKKRSRQPVRPRRAGAVVPLSRCGVTEICDGLEFARLTAFQKESELPWEALQRVLQIPTRTLARRKTAGRLTSAESDRLCRLARLFDQAVELLADDPARASRWMQSPVRGLGNERPIDVAMTEAGAKQVETLMLQLKYGVVP